MNQSDTNGLTSLHRVLLKNPQSPDVVEVLIDAGADIEAKTSRGRTALHCACVKPALESVEMLVKAGADVCEAESFGFTCLIIAARHGQTETVRYLVRFFPEVDVNHRTLLGYTALHHARQKQHTDVERVLLKHGAEE